MSDFDTVSDFDTAPDFDTVFGLPAVDDPADTETGVMLLGLDGERLVAGLGLATLTDDAALLALTIDSLRHAAPHPFTLDGLLAAGVRRWLDVRPALAAADPGPAPVTASPRQLWGHATPLLARVDVGAAGPATRAYLAACWIRRDDVDRLAARHGG